MNPILGIVLLAAVGYFGRSVFKSVQEQRNLPSHHYHEIIAHLDELVKTTQFVSKSGQSYLIWPKGIIGGVSYNGTFATNIRPLSEFRFSIVAYMYAKLQGQQSATWKLIESKTVGSLEFDRNLRAAIGVPQQTKMQMFVGNAPAPAGAPPHH